MNEWNRSEETIYKNRDMKISTSSTDTLKDLGNRNKIFLKHPSETQTSTQVNAIANKWNECISGTEEEKDWDDQDVSPVQNGSDWYT